MALAKNIERYGVKAIIGREILTARELRDLNIASNYDTLMEATLSNDDWGRFLEANPQAQEMLDWAAKEYKKWLSDEYAI